MKTVTLFLLLLLPSLSSADVQEAVAEIIGDVVVVKWKHDPKFKYSVERRTKDGPYELLATDIKGASHRDLTAEPNTLYYYLVKSYSDEIRLNVASRLIATTGAITIKGGSFSSMSVPTGITFDRNKRYSIRIYADSFEGDGSLVTSLGGLKVSAAYGKFEVKKKVFNMEVFPERLDIRDKVFSKNITFYYSGRLNINITKIELYEKEEN